MTDKKLSCTEDIIMNTKNEKLDGDHCTEKNAKREKFNKWIKRVKSVIKGIGIFGLTIISVIIGTLTLVGTLATILDTNEAWCKFSLLEEFPLCQSPTLPPCISDETKTVECADDLFAANNDHNSANLRVKTLRETSPNSYFHIGETMQVRISSDRDGYLYLFNIEPDGKLISYFPNQYCSDLQQGFIKAEKTLTIPDVFWQCVFPITKPIGSGTLITVLIEEKTEINALPLAFRHVSVQHAKFLLQLLNLQLENLTMVNEDGKDVNINWSLKMTDYEIRR
jgi:hypothetical protein